MAELFAGGTGVCIEHHEKGVKIFAINESSMGSGVARILAYMPGYYLPKDLEILRLEKPRPSEPVMGFRIVPPPAMDTTVRRVLLWRQVTPFSVEVSGLPICLQGQAPLSRLIGLEQELRGATGRDMAICVYFSHYAPLAQREVMGVFASV
ncbi:hypothetical protein [Alkalilimnicola sp. S0819]|uniref:hypothetical protein n=1 Tax=Alkalilimnicola sp. S0819 TaxID=2613922 RepID=UPI00126227FA|nr:hypothetical protein [Alkalilimnicola sp. S0819]